MFLKKGPLKCPGRTIGSQSLEGEATHMLTQGGFPKICDCCYYAAAAGRPRLFSDGPTMWNALTTMVGYLNSDGYCYNGKCHVSTSLPTPTLTPLFCK